MAHKEMKTMMRGALVLTIASFVAKILSAVYRVPFQNIVGDEGFYVYQQIYPIYGIAMTLALTGLPQFLSKIVAEQPDETSEKNILQQLFPLVVFIAISCWLFFLYGSHFIAHLMGDMELIPLIRVVSFAFLLVPIAAFYRGQFQGHLSMVPSGVSQVMEQVVRVGVILFAAYLFQKGSLSVYQTGTFAMFGAISGGIVSTIILWYYQHKFKGKSPSYLFRWKLTSQTKYIAYRLLIEGGLVSLYSAFLIFFQFVDSFFIKNALVANGLNDLSAKTAKGVYDRGQPLVQLGLVVALALSSSFLPMLTKYFVQKENDRFLQAARMFLRITTAIALAASVGLSILLRYINFTLFKDYSGNDVLGIYVFSIALMAIIQAYQSILQSKNQFLFPIIAAGIGLIIKILTTHLFTRILGTYGASLSTILGLLFTLGSLVIFSQKEVNIFVFENSFLKKLLICLIIMALSLFIYRVIILLIFGDVLHRSQAFLCAIGGVGCGGSIFLYSLIRLKVFTVREWLSLPMGKRILKKK